MAKEKSTVELKDERAQLEARKNEIIGGLKIEQRKLNEAENTELSDIAARMAGLDFELKLLEARSKQKPIPKSTPINSGAILLRAIRESVNGRISDDTNELFEAGRRSMVAAGISAGEGITLPMEYRGDIVKATITGDGQEIVTEDMLNILEPIRNKLVLVQAGANFLTGLVGNITLPSYSGSTASWEEETDSAKNGKGTFSKRTLSPKRLSAFIDISKQFLAQDSIGANAMLMSDIAKAVAVKLQSTIFGKHDTATTMPDGFFTGEQEYACKGIATFANMVAMESEVETDMALYENMSYILSPKARGVLKSTLRAANVAEGFIMDKDFVNGYKTFVTSGMASGLQEGSDEHGIVFGNWNDLVIGQWGGLDITVDPYTQAKEGMIRLVINAYFDAKVRRETSFAIGSLK